MAPKIKIIAAVSLDEYIGKDGQIPWEIPSDLARFKKLTEYGTVIMGRKTWDSLPFRPLKNRRNIVLSVAGKGLYGVERYQSFEDSIHACSKEKEVLVIGGESVYDEALKIADEVFLTEIVARTGGDAKFNMTFLKKNFRPKESTVIFEENGWQYVYSRWERNA